MAYNEFNDLVHLGSPRWSILEPILGWVEGLWDFKLYFIQVMNNREVGSILVVLAILLWYRQKWEVRRFLTSWKGMKWWLTFGNIWLGEMNDFYSEHETPAIDTPEDVAKALRFVWIPYRGHYPENSSLNQCDFVGRGQISKLLIDGYLSNTGLNESGWLLSFHVNC